MNADRGGTCHVQSSGSGPPAGGLTGPRPGRARPNRRAYRALGKAPEARTLLGTAAVSYIGDRLNTIALIALSFEFSDGALGVGGMLAIYMLPRLLIQAPAGAFVDRFAGRRLVVLVQLAMAVLAGAYALLAVWESLWLLYGLTLAVGIVRTVEIPAFELRLMALTPKELRGTANAVHTLALTAGDLIGPLLGGLLLAVTGATPLFLINAASFLAIAAVIQRLPERIAAATPDEQDEETAAAASGGYMTLLRRTDVTLLTALATAFCTLFMATIALFIVLAHDLGFGDGGVGIFYATMAVGTLIGGLAAGAGSYMTSRALAISAVTAMIGALGLVLFGAAGSVVPALLGLIVCGLVLDIQDISAMTYFQHRLPESLFGRFFSLQMMAAGAGGLIGSLAGPALEDAIGLGWTMVILAVPTLVLAVVFGVKEGGLRFAIRRSPRCSSRKWPGMSCSGPQRRRICCRTANPAGVSWNRACAG